MLSPQLAKEIRESLLAWAREQDRLSSQASEEEDNPSENQPDESTSAMLSEEGSIKPPDRIQDDEPGL